MVQKAQQDVLGPEHSDSVASIALLSQVLSSQVACLRGQEECATVRDPSLEPTVSQEQPSIDLDETESLMDPSRDNVAGGDGDSRSCAEAAQAAPATTPLGEKRKRPVSPPASRPTRKTRKQPPGAGSQPMAPPSNGQHGSGGPLVAGSSTGSEVAAATGVTNGNSTDSPADGFEERAKRAEEQCVQLRMKNRQLTASLQMNRQALSERLVQCAKKELAEEKDRVHACTHQLGRWRQTTPPVGLQKGTWEGGYEEEEIAQLKERIKQDRSDIERERRRTWNWKQRAANKKVNTGGGEDGGDDAVDEAEDIWEMREIFTHRTEALKREEQAVAVRESRLQVERALHLKRQQRLEAADRSTFHGFPLLAEKYQLLNMIGRGGFSEVYRAFNLETNSFCAVKIHELGKEMSDQQRQLYIRRAMREVDIQKTLQHPRVVTMQDCFPISTKAFGTVLQLCEGETLDEYLRIHGGLPEKEARGIVIQIFSGLKYMNTNGRKIIHYDLKPGNLFFHCGEVKIADFGLSKVVNEMNADSIDLTSQGAGTYWYLPPECFAEAGQEPPKISNKVDVWSTGVIFFEILFNRRPFGHGQSQEALRRAAMAGQAFSVGIPSAPKVSSDCKDFLKRLLTVSREGRPDVIEAYNDSYLRPNRSKNGSTSNSNNATSGSSGGSTSVAAAFSQPTGGSSSSSSISMSPGPAFNG